eukprot:CAMPEP_0117756672 /NCGR_PEP_ID=MMETSP0947-20121206/14231_1 /TAXON_ID=44440 /ORGANISM="Chattonella subsalsa, Strain CCMP2191" /LENGTH=400 /DNA_ID=CAMNT_0005576331 /DNA_START=42 /DNA_END=1244 /DNA_ORIENTATION=-
MITKGNGLQVLLAFFLFAVNIQAFSPSILPRTSVETKSSLHMTAHDNDALPVTNGNSMDRRSFMLGSTMATVLLSSNLAESAVTTSNQIPYWTLDGGVRFPTLALNTVGLSVEETERALGFATKQGITHVDFHPGKERDGVASFLSNNPNARKDLFLTTKIRKAPPGTSAEDAAQLVRNQIEEDLGILGLDQVEMLMLRDSPDCAVIQAQWKVLEDALASGKTRSIGVINYCEKALTCLLDTARVKPAVNYIMYHVGMHGDANGVARKLRAFGESRGIRTFAYGAVGEPGPSEELLSSPILDKISKAQGNKSIDEVAVRWVLQSGCAVSVRPTTNFGLGTGFCGSESDMCELGIQRRASTFGWSLSKDEMKQLDGMTSPNDNPTLFSSTGCPNSFFMPKK